MDFKGNFLECDEIHPTVDEVYSKSLEKIYGETKGLNEADRLELETELNKIENNLQGIEKAKLQLGRLLDYDNLRKEGFSPFEINKFIKEDDKSIENAEMFKQKNQELKKLMFGYPSGSCSDTAMVQYLRYLETKLSLVNNCGDSYEIDNYDLSAKIDYEQPILDKIYEHLGLKSPVIEDGQYEGPWGYISQGGSESNKWGILNGLRKYPNATVYYSKAAHYSIPKSVKMNVIEEGKEDVIKYVDCETISTKIDSEKIDVDELISKIKTNWQLHKKAAVILLTWGTTKTGAVDDVVEISRRLQELNIEHYIHLDAALFGGISKNQKDAPILPDMETTGIDSVSISLHKYFGNTMVNSVVIARNKPVCEYVDYIGITDSTICGSRSFSPFSTLQRITETFERKSSEDYRKNIILFEKLLKENKVSYLREEKSNIFIIDKPDNKICKKFQLSTFKNAQGKEKAHIIIFPHHQEDIIRELVNSLANN